MAAAHAPVAALAAIQVMVARGAHLAPVARRGPAAAAAAALTILFTAEVPVAVLGYLDKGLTVLVEAILAAAPAAAAVAVEPMAMGISVHRHSANPVLRGAHMAALAAVPAREPMVLVV